MLLDVDSGDGDDNLSNLQAEDESDEVRLVVPPRHCAVRLATRYCAGGLRVSHGSDI